MSHIRRNLQQAIQRATDIEMEIEMDEYLQQCSEKMKKSLLQHKISVLLNDPNYDEIVAQNQKNSALYTQSVIRNMTETNEIAKKLNRRNNDQTNRQPQTI